MATCPKCASIALNHTLVADSLPAHECPRCEGLLLSLVNYRHWRDTSGNATESTKGSLEKTPAEDTRDAIKCAKCQKLMVKYRVTADADNRIDYCPGCEDIWLDAGEWDLLEHLVGSKHIAALLTRPWQMRLLSETVQTMERERIKKTFGADFSKIDEFRKWISNHALRDNILAYLQRPPRK